MKKLILALILALGVGVAHSQAVSGTQVMNGYSSSTLLHTGSACFNSTCFTITSGAFSGTVSAGAYNITIQDATNAVILTLLNVSVSVGSPFNYDTYIIPLGNPPNPTAIGVNPPYLKCAPGAYYSQTNPPLPINNLWICGTGGQSIWYNAALDPSAQTGANQRSATQAYVNAAIALGVPINQIQSNTVPITPTNGIINLVAGANITLTPTGNSVSIASAAGGGLPPATAPIQIPVYPTSGSATTVPTSPTVQNSPILPSNSSFLKVPSATLTTSGWTAYHAHGSSISAGVGATSCNTGSSDCFVERLATYTGTTSTLTNFGVSSAQWCDAANEIFANENPGAGSTVLQTIDGSLGYNDLQYKGIGQYELAVAPLCREAALAMLTVPSTNKVVPSPATNWSTDTTTYGNATNPALVSTTSGAVQVFSYTIPASVVPQMVGIVYRLIDTVSATQNLGGFKVVDSYDSSTYLTNTYTVPAVATHNNPTLGGTGILWLNNAVRTAAGTYTATVTVTSPTLSTNVVAIAYLVVEPPPGTGNPVWVTGMIQNQNSWNEATVLAFQNDVNNDVSLMQQYGMDSINYVDVRNAVFATTPEMAAGATGLLHPNGPIGYANYAKAIEAPTAQPQKLPPVPDPSIYPYIRSITMTAAGDPLQCSDQIVQYSNTSVVGNIVVPWCGPSTAASLKSIVIRNNSATVALPITAGTNVTLLGALVGMQLPPQKTLTIVNGFTGAAIAQWYINNAENDPTIETSSLINPTTYTLLCTDQTKFFNAANVVITVPSTCSVTPLSKRFNIIYTGAGALTFTGPTSGDLTGLTLYTNQGATIEQYTSGAWNVLSTYANGLSLANGIPTYTAGTNVTSCVQTAGYTNTNQRGEITIVGGTATTGTVCTINFSGTLSAAPGTVHVTQNGGAALVNIGHGTASTTAVTITAGLTITGATVNIDYEVIK